MRKQDDWLAAKVGDEILMMSAAQGLYLGLNAVGARIWDLIDPDTTSETICARLIEEFEVLPDTCRVEVDAFLAQLAKHHAIALALAPTAGE